MYACACILYNYLHVHVQCILIHCTCILYSALSNIFFLFQSSVAVLEMVRRTLPVIAAAVKGFKKLTDPNLHTCDNEYLDSKLLHYANIETDHPYKPATVSHYRVKFPDQVKWMSLEFDNKCGFAQAEDKLINILIPRTSNRTDSTDTGSNAIVTPMVGINFEDLYSNFQNFGLSTPAGLLVLPGDWTLCSFDIIHV